MINYKHLSCAVRRKIQGGYEIYLQTPTEGHRHIFQRILGYSGEIFSRSKLPGGWEVGFWDSWKARWYKYPLKNRRGISIKVVRALPLFSPPSNTRLVCFLSEFSVGPDGLKTLGISKVLRREVLIDEKNVSEYEVSRGE